MATLRPTFAGGGGIVSAELYCIWRAIATLSPVSDAVIDDCEELRWRRWGGI